MKLKAIRKESRLDVRLYQKQRQKLDKFCEINNISPSQLIRNFVEDLEIIERTVTSGPLQKDTRRQSAKTSIRWLSR